MTDKEKKAIRQLEEAFKNCKEVGISFCGMDGSLLYANKSASKKGKELADEKRDSYCFVAEANKFNDIKGAGTVNTFGSYIDSGGY